MVPARISSGAAIQGLEKLNGEPALAIGERSGPVIPAPPFFKDMAGSKWKMMQRGK
jgi:hypothetical protein